MNIIPMVFSILMLLAIITYSSLQNFVLREALRAEYVCVVTTRSRDHINELQVSKYSGLQVPGEKEDNEESRGKNGPINAVSHIDLSIFEFDPTPQNEAFQKAHEEVAKRLIELLYSDRNFFQEFEKDHPDAVTELWNEIVGALRRQRQEGKNLGNAKYLANLRLEDPAYQDLLANMLKRTETSESLSLTCRGENNKPDYYPNLIDYLSATNSSPKPFRIWLAPPPLLLAIFQDPTVVDRIVDERRALYRQLDSAPKDERASVKNTLTTQFDYEFRRNIPPNMPEALINFEISLSRPKN